MVSSKVFQFDPYGPWCVYRQSRWKISRIQMDFLVHERTFWVSTLEASQSHITVVTQKAKTTHPVMFLTDDCSLLELWILQSSKWQKADTFGRTLEISHLAKYFSTTQCLLLPLSDLKKSSKEPDEKPWNWHWHATGSAPKGWQRYSIHLYLKLDWFKGWQHGKKKVAMRHFYVPKIVFVLLFFWEHPEGEKCKAGVLRQSNLCWFVGQMSPSKTSKSPTSTGLKTLNQLLQQSVPSFYQKELFFTQTSSPKLKSWLVLVRFADFADLIHIDSNWLFWQRVVFAFLFWMILFS